MRDSLIKRVIIILSVGVLIFTLIGCDSDESGVDSNVSDLDNNTISYFVAIDGSDENEGTEESPFATMEKAREVVRKNIADGMDKNIDIVIREGNYYLDTTLAFDEEDSGKDGFQIKYRNYPGERPVIYGGTIINGWEKHTESIYKVKVAELTDFNMLLENGKMAVKAREPESTYNRVLAIKSGGGISKGKFEFKENEIPQVENIKGLEAYIWPGGDDGEWNWFVNIIPVKSIDFENRTVELKRAAQYSLGSGTRYFMQGALEFLDNPGEYYFDSSDSALYYYPRNNPIEEQEIVIPSEKEIITFKGKGNENTVKNIGLEGLAITCSERGSTGIYLEKAEKITIKDCEIFNTGGNGIEAYNYAQDIKIYGNYIHDTGAAGIKISASMGLDNYVSKNNIIENNHICHTGRIIGHGHGIELRDSGRNVIRYNLIHDMPRQGINISSGERPGTIVGKSIKNVEVTQENVRDFFYSENNIIEFNDISRTNLDSQDSGSIYAWGADNGNIIRNNMVHDAFLPFSYGYGIYIDDGSDGFKIENNILHDLQKEGEGLMWAAIVLRGVNGMVYNNIIADSIIGDLDRGGGIAQNPQDEPGEDIEIFRNIYFNNIPESSDNIYYLSSWNEERIAGADDNVFYNVEDKYTIGGSDKPCSTFGEWKLLMSGKYDQYSIAADPLFMDPENDDYRLRYDSPAYKLGIKDINIQDIGLKEDYKYSDPEDTIHKLFIREAGKEENCATICLSPGSKTKIDVMARTEKGFVADLSTAEIKFEIEDCDVAVIDEKGNVEAKCGGVTKLTAAAFKNGIEVKTSMYVVVDDSEPELEILISNKELVEGKKSKIELLKKWKYGMYKPVEEDITYASGSEDVIKIDSEGNIEAVSKGEAEITATAVIDGKEKSVSVKVPVVGKKLGSVVLDYKSSEISINSLCMVGITAYNNLYEHMDIKEDEVSYDIEDATIASVKIKSPQMALIKGLKQGTTKVKIMVDKGGSIENAVINIIVK